MITMLYEKTLSRKVVSPPTQKEEESTPMAEESVESVKQHSDTSDTFWNGFFRFLRSPFRILKRNSTRTEEVNKKEPASMGKILNLMRYVHPFFQYFWANTNALFRNDVYEVAQRYVGVAREIPKTSTD